MPSSSTVTSKIHIDLDKEIKKIAAHRLEHELDKRYSPTMVQRKILKHQLWPQIREDLKIAKFLRDERGQVSFSSLNIFQWMIVAFVAVVLFGGLIYVTGLLNNAFHTIGINNEGNVGKPGYTNLTRAADITFGQMNNSIQGLRLVAITLIVSTGFMFILANGLVKIHPIFFFPYWLIIGLAVMFSATISNAYESLLQTGIYEGQLAAFTGSNWILLNLPLLTGIIGVMGGIFMFINIVTAGNQGGLR